MGDDQRPMRAFPIAAAKTIAEAYGYDQVIVIARRAGTASAPHGEQHFTTYGVDPVNSDVAAWIGGYLKQKIKRWPE